MNGIIETTQKALELLFSGDAELWSIVILSFSVSLKAVFISTPLAILLAFTLNYSKFPGIKIILTIFGKIVRGKYRQSFILLSLKVLLNLIS